MTQRFHSSRLAEIDQAAPVEAVHFPDREEVALLRRTLQKIREALSGRGEPPGRALESGRRRTRGV